MPLQELKRLQAVNRFLKLETSRQEELDNIVKLAAEICQTPIALITILDESYTYVKHSTGTKVELIPREQTFCNHVLPAKQTLEVPDTLVDGRFVNLPLVTGDSKIRFYAGTPLSTHDGHNIGTLCVLDQEPRQLTDQQKLMLEILSRQIIHILEFEFSVNILKAQYVEARNSENKLRSFFESSESIHLLIGPEMEVLAHNKSFYDFVNKMYGVKIQIGMKAIDYVHHLYVYDFIKNFNLALIGTPIKHERLLDYGVAGSIWCHITYNPAYDREGNIIGISFNVSNINERKHHEQKILQQNQALRKIAYFQSHGLRKPVASILGLMNIVKMDGYGHNEESLTMMEAATMELDDMIHKIVSSTHLLDDEITINNDFTYPEMPVA
ncbi:GAF domain-containing protein [Mucilaginibacter robiniae]|uniref:GAF domain-containing protein n=1 Tax=Mucilaginibacter robiniae TaxID=2728022 RepID=A0A7L5DUX7_9SPHI|nr:GAF domain-containing protein [Mucilaginibacter robiniae]QJD94511.1 GAF domain-containing protein [Mucilaginibacter robiniae]